MTIGFAVAPPSARQERRADDPIPPPDFTCLARGANVALLKAFFVRSIRTHGLTRTHFSNVLETMANFVFFRSHIGYDRV